MPSWFFFESKLLTDQTMNASKLLLLTLPCAVPLFILSKMYYPMMLSYKHSTTTPPPPDYSKLKTGDIVFFTSFKHSALQIIGWTGCEWSHVGMVIIDKVSKKPLLFHADSNSDGLQCLNCGDCEHGAHVHSLDDYYENGGHDYSFRIEVWRLNTKDNFQLLRKTSRRHCHITQTKFDFDLIHLARAAVGGSWISPPIELPNVRFCSQLVAEEIIKRDRRYTADPLVSAPRQVYDFCRKYGTEISVYKPTN